MVSSSDLPPSNCERGNDCNRQMVHKGSSDKWRVYRFRLFKLPVLIIAIVIALIFLSVSTLMFYWPTGLAAAVAFVVGSVIYVAKL